MNGEIPVLVREVRPLAPDIKEFCLAREDGQALPPFSGGSHILVALPLGERTHLNAYSLTGDGEAGDYRIAVRREIKSRGGSHFMHDEVRPGHKLCISHPVNLFSLSRTARHHILVAGGIGITPILAQVRQLKRLGASFEVHYAYRNPDQGAFADQLKDLAGPAAHFTIDSLGQFIQFPALLANRALGTHLYICGPTGLRDAAFTAARSLGWPTSHLHSEQFLHPLKGKLFQVSLAKSGRELSVSPDTSLLEAIESAGVAAPYLCRGGACGQCETEVLEAEGEFLHHDVYLTEAEKASRRKIMPCVSRFEGKCLILNL